MLLPKGQGRRYFATATDKDMYLSSPRGTPSHSVFFLCLSFTMMLFVHMVPPTRSIVKWVVTLVVKFLSLNKAINTRLVFSFFWEMLCPLKRWVCLFSSYAFAHVAYPFPSLFWRSFYPYCRNLDQTSVGTVGEWTKKRDSDPVLRAGARNKKNKQGMAGCTNGDFQDHAAEWQNINKEKKKKKIELLCMLWSTHEHVCPDAKKGELQRENWEMQKSTKDQREGKTCRQKQKQGAMPKTQFISTSSHRLCWENLCGAWPSINKQKVEGSWKVSRRAKIAQLHSD